MRPIILTLLLVAGTEPRAENESFILGNVQEESLPSQNKPDCCPKTANLTGAVSQSASLLRTLVDTSDFPPRWQCGTWTSAHGWVHIISDFLIWGAYTSIPIMLVYYIRKRRDLPFPRIFWLFALFILSCGAGHLVEAIIFWWPAYRVSALVKMTTATVSWLTVFALIPVIPKALIWPSLKKVNQTLEEEIRKRAQIEESLQIQTARLSGIVNTAADAIITFDHHGIIESANQAAERMFGWKVEEMVGLSVSILMPTHKFDQYGDPNAKPAPSDETDVLGIGREVTGLRRDGKTLAVELAVSRTPLADQSFFTGIIRDINERRQSDELFRNTVEAAPNGMVLVDAKGKIALVNTYTEKLFGYERGEMIGKQVEQLVPPRYREAHVAERGKYASEPDARPMGIGRDLFGIRKNGTEFPLEIGLNPLVIRNKRYVLATVIDITCRKETERELSRQSEELTTSNAELARKIAELDEFTVVASHDLQEPLRKLIAFGGLLKKDLGDNLPERAARDIDFITEASSRMRSLVDDLLSLSRTGRETARKEQISLDECANRALSTLAPRIEESSAVIERDELPKVFGDRTLLTQLYQNLIGNALKYRHKDRPPVIRLTAEQKDGKWILGVLDNGIGIKPEYHEQIFTPFKRLHGRGEYEGTGIGLAICRKAVERHGGRIWVESEANQGSHFKFSLDAKKEPPCPGEKAPEPLSSSWMMTPATRN